MLGKVFPSARLALPHVVIDSLREALKTGKYAEYVKLDVKNFYPSIPHAVLIKALKQKIRKPEVLALLTSAVETATVPESKGGKGSKPNKKGVPQGLSISNVLAEITLQAVDTVFKSRSDIWFRRYVDDILILAPLGTASVVAKEVTESLSELGLEVHAPGLSGSKSKIASLSESFTFLGYEIREGEVSIRRESVLKFEASLASIFTGCNYRIAKARNDAEKANAIALCQWKLNLRITGCIFEGRRLGWVFYFSQITNTARLRAVNRTIETLIRRFHLVGKIKPKSLIKTYYESARKDKLSHKYIPNFDTMLPVEQRRILSLLLGESRIRKLSDSSVGSLFKMKISVAVRELEADLAGVS